MVGQQINLSIMLPPAGTTAYQWSIPGMDAGTAFKDYQPNATNSNYTPLAPSDLTNSFVSFYCLAGGSISPNCTLTVNGHALTIPATINVVRPSATITATQGVIAADTNFQASQDGIPWLHFGRSGRVGMYFTQTNSIPSGYSGIFQWVQLLNTDIITRTTTTTTNTVGVLPGNDGGINNEFPYGNDPGDPIGTSDSPGSKLRTNNISVLKSFAATMYLMWQPDSTNALVGGDRTVLVPLRSYQWSWNGTATNAAPTNNGTGWGLQSKSYPTATSDVDATIEPVWTTNSANSYHVIP